MIFVLMLSGDAAEVPPCPYEKTNFFRKKIFFFCLFISCIYNTNCRKDLLILGYSTSVVVGVDGCWVSSVFRCYFPPGRGTFIHHTYLVVTRSMLMTYFPRHAIPSWIVDILLVSTFSPSSLPRVRVPWRGTC